MADLSPEEKALEAQLKASLAGKYDLGAAPDPTANATSSFAASMYKAPDETPAAPAPETKTEAPKDKTVEMLLGRIADLEGKWETERKAFEARLAERDKTPEPPPQRTEPVVPNPSWVTRDQFIADPAGVLSKDGIPFDFVAASLVAAEMKRLGQTPDATLLAKVNQFPQLAQVSGKVSSQVEMMAARLAAIEEERANEKYEAELLRASATVDKEKFPKVAEARGRDSLAVEAKLREIVMMDAASKPKTSPRLTPEQVIQRYEADLVLAAKLLAFTPTSTQGATGDTSMKTPPATAANLGGAPAAVPATTPEEFDRELKAMIVKKYGG